MRVDTFSFSLPEEQIARQPTERREDARLLVLPKDRARAHRHVRDLPELLPDGALVVLNDTQVIPARLLGKKQTTGGRVEILLLEPLDSPGQWRALGRASKPIREGTVIAIEGLSVRVARIRADATLEVELSPTDGLSVDEAIAHAGRMPLPPYIRRDASPRDRERYQTVFARVPGAVAAPTAGLHFSHELLERIEARGFETIAITLHVGLGTFAPVKVDDLDDHAMHEERFEISHEASERIAVAMRAGRPIVAVGTTVVRALESAYEPGEGRIRPGCHRTRLLIQPGYAFQTISHLMTNFHLPRSTLLALVCAFGGTRSVLGAYQEAIELGYRFYSYGDATLVERAP